MCHTSTVLVRGLSALTLACAACCWAADPQPPWVIDSPITGTVATVVTWAHGASYPIPPPPWWAYWVGNVPVQQGQTVTVTPEGHPVHAVVAFTGVGGWPYVEYQFGQHPSMIFADGFESGTTAAWTAAQP